MPRTFTQFLKGWFPSASLYVEARCGSRSPSSLPAPRGNSEDDATGQVVGLYPPPAQGSSPLCLLYTGELNSQVNL